MGSRMVLLRRYRYTRIVPETGLGLMGSDELKPVETISESFLWAARGQRTCQIHEIVDDTVVSERRDYFSQSEVEH